MPRPRLPGTTAVPGALTALAAVTLAALASARDRIGHLDERSRAEGRDGGYSTETVLVIALLVALAIVVIGIIANLVIDRANSIEL